MSKDFTAERAKLIDAQSAAKAEHARTAFAALNNPKLEAKLTDLEHELEGYATAFARLDAAEAAAKEAAGHKVAVSIEARRRDAAKAADSAMQTATREAGRLDKLLSELGATLDRIEAAHATAADALSDATQAAAELVPAAGGMLYAAAVNLGSSARGCQLRSPLMYRLSQILANRPLLGPVSWTGLVQADDPLADAAGADEKAMAVLKTWTAENLTAALPQREV
ncbi:MAG: hypothetical protein QE290_19195 [Acidovorax sp.]|uniref:hypothetical protein n=1 Tax=Acidovorax sp. TaxID=1872122 RepID=UPI00263461CC|nr:hypothetical protein [Acidovorax sp.]MDH4466159.1 hypothetical protein [Acidovorax sp.]